MIKYALFQNDKQISKIYPHKEQTQIDAYEKGLVLDCASDFGFKGGKMLISGVEIRKIETSPICNNCAFYEVGNICLLKKKPQNNKCDEFANPEAFKDFCDCREERNLDLPLKHEWYDKITSGEKTSEYREIKQYWENRFSQWDYKYTTVTFRRAYTNTSMKFKIISIAKTKESNDLGLPECYEIKLGGVFIEFEYTHFYMDYPQDYKEEICSSDYEYLIIECRGSDIYLMGEHKNFKSLKTWDIGYRESKRLLKKYAAFIQKHPKYDEQVQYNISRNIFGTAE